MRVVGCAMSECVYAVSTNWKELKNYDKEKADSLVARIAKTNDEIYTKILKNQNTIIFKGPDRDRAGKVKSLLSSVGIHAIIEEIPLNKESMTAQGASSTVIEDANAIFDTVFKKLLYCVRFIAIFPVLLFSKFSKKEISVRMSYTILMLVAYLGLYDLTLGTVLSPIYDLSYNYSLKSFMATAAIFVVTAAVKGIMSVGVAALTGLGDFLNKVLELLGNGLIALTAQTILLKIAQQGFLLKYGLSAGFGLGIFETSRQFGEKIVTITIFIYILLPVVVASEAYVFEQVTRPQIETIKAEYEKVGGIPGMTKTALFGAVGAVWDNVKSTFLNEDSDRKNEHIEQLKSFLMIVLEGVLYILFSVIFLSVISPFVSYKLFKHLSISVVNSSYYVSLISNQRRNV